VPVEGGQLPADLHLPPAGPGPGIVLFQEIFGVTAYVTARARDLAALGYAVLVPHVYWRQGDPVIEDGDDALPRAMAAMGRLDWDEAVADGAAALAALRARPEVTGPVGVVGFCFGGGLAFAISARSAASGTEARSAAGGTQAGTAAAGTGPDALVSYYGSALPNLLHLAGQVRCPSLHHFGLNDAYIPADVVRRIEAAVTTPAADTTFRTYPGAGHAFDNPSPAFHHAAAARQAWAATEDWLAERLPVRAPGE
jgi:carboxymethylenebutenolidase